MTSARAYKKANKQISSYWTLLRLLIKSTMHKLQHYGIIGKSVRWMENWLANRKQSVVSDGSTSDAVSVDSGVPQVSLLGPGVLLYYITDLQSRLTSTVRLLADDQ
jgi:hypothetical protein